LVFWKPIQHLFFLSFSLFFRKKTIFYFFHFSQKIYIYIPLFLYPPRKEMSHSSSITSSTNGTITSSYLYHGRTSPILTERFPVPTPPPSSSSPVELAPILDICDSAIIGKKDFC
jgi:hypothetical protein